MGCCMIHGWVKGIVLSSLSAGPFGWGRFPERASVTRSDRRASLLARRDQGWSGVRGVAGLAGAGRSSELVQNDGRTPGTMPQVIARRLLHGAACVGAVVLTAGSAIAVKEARHANISPVPLASVDKVDFAEIAHLPVAKGQVSARGVRAAEHVPEVVEAGVAEVKEEGTAVLASSRGREQVKQAELWPLGTRFFNGRPIRPVRTMRMVVTGYSPDSRSCGEFADGRTATLHSVQTNAHRLVAADPRVLAYGSMLTVPGYDGGNVVPVLDCGGAIKGNRLDLLFPTHEQALRWGKKTVTVTVWGYADGKPAPNPRKAREGKA